jgi:hypothetical protein
LSKLQQNQGKIEALANFAPKELKTDVQTLVDAAHKALQTGDATAFGSDPQLAAAGERLNAACGINTAPAASQATPGAAPSPTGQSNGSAYSTATTSVSGGGGAPGGAPAGSPGGGAPGGAPAGSPSGGGGGPGVAPAPTAGPN